MQHPGICTTFYGDTMKEIMGYTQCCRKKAQTVQHHTISYLSI
jgi:hypothetical protein